MTWMAKGSIEYLGGPEGPLIQSFLGQDPC